MRRWLVGSVVVLWAAIAPAAAGASGWSIQPIPNPAGSVSSDLFGASCTTSQACVAAGDYFTAAGTAFTLVERWNGATWEIQPTPAPAGASFSRLFGVSCTAARDCTAVGIHSTSSGAQVTLAEHWNGVSWEIQPTPNLAGATALLNGVSCTAARDCTAVGEYFTRAGSPFMLAERWNGSRWEVQTTPNPAGAITSSLSSVSCPTPRDCTAVGSYEPSSGPVLSLAERWNGISWEIQPTPNPAGVKTFSSFNGVSCATPRDCTAVGGYSPSTGPFSTLAERWNGISWEIQPTPNPAGVKTFSSFSGVSCATPRDCTAVGGYSTSSGAQVTLAEHWNGVSWEIQPTPNLAGATATSLFGVSCSTERACTAVGSAAFPAVTLAEGFSAQP